MASSVFPHAKLDWTISKLEERISANSEDLDARLELSQTLLSRGWMHGGGEADCSAALSLARRVLQEDPTSVTALVVAGMALVCMERVDAAEKYLAQARRGLSGPTSAGARALETLRGDHGTAVRHLETACRLARVVGDALLLGLRADESRRAPPTAGWSTSLLPPGACDAPRPDPDQHPQILRTWACAA